MTRANARWTVQGAVGDAQSPDRLALLVVAPGVPYPPIWGFGQRTFQLARSLARDHNVTMVCYANLDQLPDVESMAAHVNQVVAVPRRTSSGVARRLHQSARLFSGMPFHAAALQTRELQSAVDDTLARGRFDAVILESSQMGWLRLPPTAPILVDEHNIESELLARMAHSERSLLRRRFNESEARRYERFEDTTWGRSRGCATTSQRDASLLTARRPDLPVAVVPNGVDVEHFQPRGVPECPDRLVFTGLLDYRPNYDGILWFLDEVFPLIRSCRPAAHVHVVGHGTPEVLSSLSRPGVQVTGRVPDLRDELEAAAVALVPLRIGGGTRLKIVEAMAMGRPIVSTTLGAEGIDARHGEELLLADDPQAFAKATCQLLDDPESRSLMATRARALAADRYSWSRSTRELVALIEQVLSAGDSVRAR